MTSMKHVPEVQADPAALGLDPEKLGDLLARARRGLEEAGLPSLQLAVAREGRLALFAQALKSAGEMQNLTASTWLVESTYTPEEIKTVLTPTLARGSGTLEHPVSLPGLLWGIAGRTRVR